MHASPGKSRFAEIQVNATQGAEAQTAGAAWGLLHALCCSSCWVGLSGMLVVACPAWSLTLSFMGHLSRLHCCSICKRSRPAALTLLTYLTQTPAGCMINAA